MSKDRFIFQFWDFSVLRGWILDPDKHTHTMNSNRKKSDKSCKFVCGADFKKAASIDAHSTITGQTRTGDHRSFFTPRERERGKPCQLH